MSLYSDDSAIRFIPEPRNPKAIYNEAYRKLRMQGHADLSDKAAEAAGVSFTTKFIFRREFEFTGWTNYAARLEFKELKRQRFNQSFPF
jgi:hypothetical protein